MRIQCWVVIALAGCARQGAATIDEGCRDELLGEELLEGPADTLARVDCYRGYLGLGRLRVKAPVQSAATAHAAWLATYDKVNPENEGRAISWGAVTRENKGTDGFTGLSPYDRNVAAGALPPGRNVSRASVWGLFRFEADVDVDVWIQDPFVRDALFQPLVLGVGEARAEISGADRAYVDVYAALPPGARAYRPVLYPKDGQEEVPTSWRNPWQLWQDPLAAAGGVGFPITVTVGAETLGTDEGNPYGMVVSKQRLVDEHGDEVALATMTPSLQSGWVLATTAVFAATEALQPDTTYTFSADVRTLTTTVSVQTTFRTTAAADVSDDTDDDSDVDTDPDSDAP